MIQILTGDKEEKYLVVGSTGHMYVDCIPWDISTLPNIVDYDVVFINVRSLTDETLTRVSNRRFKELRQQLVRLLYSAGSIVVLSDFRRQHKRPKEYRSVATNYSWCPIEIGLSNESGTTIEIRENLFPKYFSNFTKWKYYFYLPKECLTEEFSDYFGPTHKVKYQFPSENLVVNRYGKMLSGFFSCEVYYKRQKFMGYGSPYEYYEDKADKAFGLITVLPLLHELDDREAVNLLLEDLLKKPQKTLPPEWIAKVQMPLVQNIDSEIEKRRLALREVQEEISSLEKKKDDIESYRKLLYADGIELQDIFKKCLEEMGGIVSPAKYSDEEYILQYKGKEYLVEVKGASKSIALTHLRQLTDYMLKYEEETGRKCKGILFGNPWRNMPINERSGQDKPHFPQNVIDRARAIGIALISSSDFFAVFCSFLENRSLGDQILGAIVQSEGLVTFTTIGEN